MDTFLMEVQQRCPLHQTTGVCCVSVRHTHLLLPPGHVGGLLRVERVGYAPQDEHVDLKFNLSLFFLLLDPLALLPLLLFTCSATVFSTFAVGSSRCGGPALLAARPAVAPAFPRRGRSRFPRSLLDNFWVGVPAGVFAGGRVQHGSGRQKPASGRRKERKRETSVSALLCLF